MGNTDSIPVVSQVKSLVQVIGGDAEGARHTQENFAYRNTFPGVSQVASLGYVIGGDLDKARDLQKEFAKNMERIVDSIPVAGHVKGVVHFAVGDDKRGEEVMKAANRGTLVTAGGIAGFVVGGPAGAVAGGIAGGQTADTLHTAIDPGGPEGIYRVLKDLGETGGEGAAGKIFDQTFSITMDGASGLAAGKLAVRAGPGKTAGEAGTQRVSTTSAEGCRRRKRRVGGGCVIREPVSLPSNPKIVPTDLRIQTKLPSTVPEVPVRTQGWYGGAPGQGSSSLLADIIRSQRPSGSLPKPPASWSISVNNLGIATAVGSLAQNVGRPMLTQSQSEDKEKKEGVCADIVRGMNLIPDDGVPGRNDAFRDEINEFRNAQCRVLEFQVTHAADLEHVILNEGAWNPVQNIYLMPQPADDQGHGLPVLLHAELTQAGPRNCDRTDFGPEWLLRMQFMGARENRPHDLDEKGHILASQFCGPNEWYNLAPQTARVNRNVGGAGQANTWTNMERGVRRFFNNNCGTIHWVTHVHYNIVPGDVRSHRPRAFKICPFFLDPNYDEYDNGRVNGMYVDNSW